MEDEADLSYQGNLEDNVLRIFNMLSTDDKKTFLRHGVRLIWEQRIELSKNTQPDIVIDDITINPVAVASELESISAVDYREQQRLRSFLYMAFFTIGTVVFGIGTWWAWNHGSVKEDGSGLLKLLAALVEQLIKLF